MKEVIASNAWRCIVSVYCIVPTCYVSPRCARAALSSISSASTSHACGSRLALRPSWTRRACTSPGEHALHVLTAKACTRKRKQQWQLQQRSHSPILGGRDQLFRLFEARGIEIKVDRTPESAACSTRGAGHRMQRGSARRLDYREQHLQARRWLPEWKAGRDQARSHRGRGRRT
jgi:hypothetical protein